MFTSAGVARRMGVTPACVRVWARQGKLMPEATVAGIRLFAEADIQRLEAERAVAR
jgi:DNA-binding transcriptional MerR regulator